MGKTPKMHSIKISDQVYRILIKKKPQLRARSLDEVLRFDYGISADHPPVKKYSDDPEIPRPRGPYLLDPGPYDPQRPATWPKRERDAWILGSEDDRTRVRDLTAAAAVPDDDEEEFILPRGIDEFPDPGPFDPGRPATWTKAERDIWIMDGTIPNRVLTSTAGVPV
jgi:hypothetical protein